MSHILLLGLTLLAYQPPPKPLDLGPRDVLVVANSLVPASLEIARYYVAKRGVPAENLIELPLPVSENIGRVDFDRQLRDELQQQVRKRKPDAKILLLVHGVPLRVLEAVPSESEKQKAATVRTEKEALTKQVEEAKASLLAATKANSVEPSAEHARTKETAERTLRTLEAGLRRLDDSLLALTHADSVASVDSELALLGWGKYPLARWQLNPQNWLVPRQRRAQAPPVLMVARIDGPSAELCKRMIDDAIETEKHGLEGELWVDSRGIMYNPVEDPGGASYGGYDESLRELYRLVKDNTNLPAHIDVKPELFAAQACKNCALYCGWYSHAQFVDCCIFRKGAVAVHIASSEAVSLREPHCTYWCKNQLEKGACATMGPVAEPYLFAFPRPEEFFGFLVTGEYTLAECYYNTLSVNSWRMVLVGDPLYRPYAKKPLLKPEQIKPSPQGAKNVFGG